MYFVINEEKVFDKRNEIWKNVSNVVAKKINSELVYNEKCIKAENKINAKESFQCFYIPVILIDLVYKKNENYYPKVILEKYDFNKNRICSNYSYYEDSDEEYYDEKYIDLFLETIRTRSPGTTSVYFFCHNH